MPNMWKKDSVIYIKPRHLLAAYAVALGVGIAFTIAGIWVDKTIFRNRGTQLVTCGKLEFRVKVDHPYPTDVIQKEICPQICENN